MRKSTEERFWSKVDKSGECWVWVASCYPAGYGKFWDGEKLVLAHRLSYEWANGDIPEAMQADHRCHTRNCVRPDHLRLVTNAQNGQNRRGAQSNSVTGTRGVSWHKRARKYQAQVKLGGKRYSAGYFDTLEEAEAAAIAKRRDVYTHDDYAEWAATTEAALTPGTGANHVQTR